MHVDRFDAFKGLSCFIDYYVHNLQPDSEWHLSRNEEALFGK